MTRVIKQAAFSHVPNIKDANHAQSGHFRPWAPPEEDLSNRKDERAMHAQIRSDQRMHSSSQQAETEP